ncbi:hypothetical protein [Kitasatospora purpeofusca]
MTTLAFTDPAAEDEHKHTCKGLKLREAVTTEAGRQGRRVGA